MATIKRSKRSPEKLANGRRTLDGWRGKILEVHFSAEDLDLLDNVLTVAPVLRIVAAIGQEARKHGLQYPVTGVADLLKCLGNTTLDYQYHRIDAESIAHTMLDEWFPIAHEGELLSRVHLALLRCEMEARPMVVRPSARESEGAL